MGEESNKLIIFFPIPVNFVLYTCCEKEKKCENVIETKDTFC